jgi:hypothetical protein
MNNHFQTCPPLMNDGRLFTDYRSSQIREAYFNHRNCVSTENAARTLRIDNADRILDAEWEFLSDKLACKHPRKQHHNSPTTKTTTELNNAELLAYNKVLSSPNRNPNCYDYRATETCGSKKQLNKCRNSAVHPLPHPNSHPHTYPNNTCKSNNNYPSNTFPERLYKDYQHYN